jgi:hypothetical protein
MEYMPFFKNNIIVQYGTNGQNPNVYGGQALATVTSTDPNWCASCNPPCLVTRCNNNLMWREWGAVSFTGQFSGLGKSGTPSGWSGWVSYGGSGVHANPLFVNNVRENRGYVIDSNSPARNAGKDLREFIESKGLPWTDILGNPRDNSPDIGAYEYAENHGNSDSQNNSYNLSQNYPNPFNPSTAIEYYIPQLNQVKLVVYNLICQEIQTLVDGEKSSGFHGVKFIAANLPSGIYFYRLLAADFMDTKKMVLIK